MDSSKKRIVMSIQNGPITTLSKCLTLVTLLIASVNFRPVESKSMPINQLPFQLQPSQQMLPSKIPMIFLSKPQQQQQQQQYQSQQDFRQTSAASGVSSNGQQSIIPANGPQQMAKAQQVAAAAAASQAQQVASSASGSNQQKPEMIQTSASYVNEISAPQPSQVSTRIQYRPRQQQSKISPVPIQVSDQLIKASATQQQNNIAEADESDSDSSDGEMGDMNDEPEPATQAMASSGKIINSNSQQSGEESLTRRRPASSGSSSALASSSSRLATIESVTRQRYNGPHTLPYHANDHRDQLPEGPAQGDESGAATRKEQENAEASEAEVADRSALDEQQQAQREIILAQAQSEAKAIKEQQESLMKQQALQQQMIMRRQNELDDRNNRSIINGNRGGSLSPSSDRRSQQQHKLSNPNGQQLKKQRAQRQQNYLDDQAAEERRGYEGFVSKNTNQDEDADYSFRRPLSIARHPSSSSSSPSATSGSIPKYGVNDLLPAAQHSYGAHYAPLHGYQKDYYQFAESFKKGQFHSGFKRGGNKFQISGHASQHKSHAEGHVKWNGYKGKGVSYWNYQHGDNKKHYGDSHGGHHGYYH